MSIFFAILAVILIMLFGPLDPTVIERIFEYSLLSLVNAGAVVVTAIATAITAVAIVYSVRVAIKQIKETQKREKINNSFHHIVVQTRDSNLSNAFAEFAHVKSELNRSEIGSFSLAEVSQGIGYNTQMLIVTDVIRKVFNYYEATAIGVMQQALESQIIEKWWRTSYVSDFIDFSLYIYQKRLQGNAPKLYSEYESLARKWATSEERARIDRVKKHVEDEHLASLDR